MTEPSRELSTLRTIFRARPATHRFRDPESARRELEQFIGTLPGPPAHTARSVRMGGVPCEWVEAGAQEASPPKATDAGGGVVVLLHGGGYVSGSLVSHRGLAARVTEETATPVLVVDYRRAPEEPFPAAYDDALAAVEGVIRETEGPLALVGDSAGGGLALAVSMALRDGGGRLPVALACLSPWTDLAVTGESVDSRAKVDPLFDRTSLVTMAGHYAGEHPLTDPRISPLYGDLQGLPPTLIQVGDAEVLLSDSTRLAERLRMAGVEVELDVWPHAVHGWQMFAGLLPEGREALRRIGAFLRPRLGHHHERRETGGPSAPSPDPSSAGDSR